jgi:serine/threonine protein kinase
VASSLVGRKLGIYQITDMLGQGGMATVYKGYRADIDRTVAIKVLPPHPGLNQEFIERFKLEARTIARLQHPHILPLYDYGAEDDILYLVMAYVEGGSLGNLIDRGPMPPKQVEPLLKQMSAALDYAHREGVIHRDIKPDNVLLDKEGNVLLADFGIVKLAGGSSSRLTVTGGLVGTPAYMSPEQGRGEDITGSADIYSLGVVVYEMLTGRQPYSADTPMQIIIKHMNEPVPSIRTVIEDLPASLDLVMQRALAKDPQTRYQTAAEFANDFTRAIHTDESVAGGQIVNQPVPTMRLDQPPASTPKPTEPMIVPTLTVQPSPYSNPLVLLGGFAIIAVLIVAVVVLVLNNSKDGGGEENAVVTVPTAALESAVVLEPTAVPKPTFGRLSFSTTSTLGDTVTVQVQNLTPPDAGEVYIAWLENTVDGSVLKLGELTLDALGSGVLTPYVDSGGRLLPAFFNAVTLTLEKPGAEQPSGTVAYSASVPKEVSQALKAIFITSPDGIAVSRLQSSEYSAPAGGGDTAGLLESALGEGSKAQQHAGLAQIAARDNKNVGSMHTHNEHTINIVLGTKDDYDGDGTGQNPGYGVGVVHLVDLMSAQLDMAINAPDSTPTLQSSLEIIRICLVNTRQRVDRLVGLEKQMLAADTIDDAVLGIANDSSMTATQLINGFDDNGNGQVEPFENECGLQQIETFGLLVSSMSLVEGPLAGT